MERCFPNRISLSSGKMRFARKRDIVSPEELDLVMILMAFFEAENYTETG
jgi:hypothetical protein